jgi:hypothetical protein
LPSGIYFARVITKNGGLFTGKFVKNWSLEWDTCEPVEFNSWNYFTGYTKGSEYYW